MKKEFEIIYGENPLGVDFKNNESSDKSDLPRVKHAVGKKRREV